MFDHDIQPCDAPCPKCGHDTLVTRDCTELGCEDGWIDGYDEDPLYYDRGDFYPCPECRGHGSHCWCQSCGWDAFEKRYLNGLAIVFFPLGYDVDAWCAQRQGYAAPLNETQAILY